MIITIIIDTDYRCHGFGTLKNIWIKFELTDLPSTRINRLKVEIFVVYPCGRTWKARNRVNNPDLGDDEMCSTWKSGFCSFIPNPGLVPCAPTDRVGVGWPSSSLNSKTCSLAKCNATPHLDYSCSLYFRYSGICRHVTESRTKSPDKWARKRNEIYNYKRKLLKLS